MGKLRKLSLGKKILIGIVIGLAIGFISPKAADTLKPLGDIFLRLLKMLMVPLVFFSITSGVCKMGDIKQLYTVGLRFILYIIVTSGITACIGVLAGFIVQPGRGTTEFLDASAEVESVSYSFIDNIISWVPENVVQSMQEANMPQIIIFAIFLGVALLALGQKAELLIKVIDQGSEAMLKITEFVMAFSPIGIASLMATIIVLIVLYPVIIKCLAKLQPLRFMKNIVEPIIVAASTTSSAATLPVSIKTAQEKLGIPENIYGFTLPLGNTCGMNGFSLFIGLCCIFASNLYGFAITPGRVVQFIFLGIILSVGAAGVKGAGIVMSTVLLETMGMPLSLIPILAAIWPAIDPAHTVLNNTSDLVGTTVVSCQLNKTDMAIYDK